MSEENKPSEQLDTPTEHISRDESSSSESEFQGTGFLNTIKSVAMGFMGIQSGKNRERDFTKGKASDFIIVGIVMTILFVVVLFSIVSSIVEDAGM